MCPAVRRHSPMVQGRTTALAQIVSETSVTQVVDVPADVRRPITGVTWRYLGDRTVADSAYCARFNVLQAPEPMVSPDGAWAYSLPAAKSPR